jgi:hypothetical protein
VHCIPSPQSISIPKSALVARIDREVLRRYGARLLAKPKPLEFGFGTYTVVSESSRMPLLSIDDHDELEEFGRYVGALAPYEVLNRA